MIKTNDEIFELVCITPMEYNPNEYNEMSLGYYSSQELANEQKDICQRQANEELQNLEYTVKKHRIIM